VILSSVPLSPIENNNQLINSMKKKYIIIETFRNTELKTSSVFLLTDNVTGYIFENDETRIYFKYTNPFAYIKIYLNAAQFRFLNKPVEIQREGTIFRYSTFEE
jgi:hypothetical protein